MNVLYISIMYSDITGGALCRENTKKALSTIECVKFYEYLMDLKQSLFLKIYSVIRGYKCGFDIRHFKKIIDTIEKNKIDVVFCDPALYGVLVAKIKKKKNYVKVLSFFHNCEYSLYASVYSKSNPLIRLAVLNSVRKNEFLTLKFSDVCFFLTERDLHDVQSVYHISPKRIVFSPIALENTYKNTLLSIKKIFPKKLLFVGSYFKPNIDGILWFVKRVLPHVDYTLTIVGRGFDSKDFTKNICADSKIRILGFIESLDEVYETHDVVVQPVFYGSGMKTKTAECLMYGKPLITTIEGMIGYNVSNENIFICNSEIDFIETLDKLQKYGVKEYDNTLHDIYQNNYSTNARRIIFQKLLETL